MPRTSIAYRALLRLGVLLAPALGRGDKAGAGHRGRAGAAARLAAWARAGRDRGRPLVWFHASSVGEGLQAESVLLELRRLCRMPEPLHPLQSIRRDIVASPPGGRGRLPALRSAGDRHDRLLADARAGSPGVRQARPLARARHPGRGRRGDGGAGGRNRRPEKRTPALARAGAGSGRVRVGGGRGRDRRRGRSPPRAARRAARADPGPGRPAVRQRGSEGRAVSPVDPLLALGGPGATLVAGSTWPPDERVLLRAFAGVRKVFPARA